MYSLYEYDYKTKNSRLLAKGSERNMLCFRETYLSDKIVSIIGTIDNFDDYISQKKYAVTNQDYKDTRVFVSKGSNNMSKLTLNQIFKTQGFMYNNFQTMKIISVYLFKSDEYESFTPALRRLPVDSFELHPQFSECVKQVTNAEYKPSPIVIDEDYASAAPSLSAKQFDLKPERVPRVPVVIRQVPTVIKKNELKSKPIIINKATE